MLWSATAMVEAQVYVIRGTIAQWYFSMDASRPKHVWRSSLSQENGSGFVNHILRRCANAFLSAVDFPNKFTINFAAITGEAHCTAARMIYELLKHNLLSALIVEIVSTPILAGIVLVLSAVYALVDCAILKALIHLGDEAYLVGVALMAWILLIGFFIHVLDIVIDTVYICYAMDRGEFNKPDVYKVYVHLPIRRSQCAGFVPRTPLLV